MTAQDLVVIIFSAIFVQVAIYAAMVFYRHWLRYEELKKRLLALENIQEAPVKKQARAYSPLKASWDGFRDFRVQRKVFENKNKDVCSFYLFPLDGKPLPSFNPGQYLTFQFHITLPGMSGSQTIIRCYSLSDSPHPETYRITVKKIPAPSSHPDAPSGISSTYLHEQVHEGTVLSVKAPAGYFCLEDHLKGPLVLIVGGIGITPLLSMLNTCLHVDPQREVWFYYGLRNGLEHLMKEHLEALAKNHKNLHLHVCYSQPNAEDIQGVDYQYVGHIDITLLRLTLFLKLYQFEHGFLAGMLGKVGGQFGLLGSILAAGTAAELGGGKFLNGAVSGAFVYLFNEVTGTLKSRETTEKGSSIKSFQIGLHLPPLLQKRLPWFPQLEFKYEWVVSPSERQTREEFYPPTYNTVPQQSQNLPSKQTGRNCSETIQGLERTTTCW